MLETSVGTTVYVVREGRVIKETVKKETATGFRCVSSAFYKTEECSGVSALPWNYLSSHITKGYYASLTFKTNDLCEANNYAKKQLVEFDAYINQLRIEHSSAIRKL